LILPQQTGARVKLFFSSYKTKENENVENFQRERGILFEEIAFPISCFS